MDPIVQRLLKSAEPIIRYKTLVNVLNCSPISAEVQPARADLAASPVFKALLQEQDPGTGEIPHHPYSKWRGAHWVLACLADLGHPPGDERLRPMVDQVYGWLLSPGHQKSIQTINGRVRRCASQEGNALFAALKLGLADERAHELAKRLVRWQWPDGGWNCDKRPEAIHSSFMESLIPLRALALYSRESGDLSAGRAAERAAEIFLKRELFKRQRDGAVIEPDFLRLHYPPYWHYDILFALKVMAEAGRIGDPRCAAALNELEAKRLPDGGFPAEGRYYYPVDQRSGPTGRGTTPVEWGGVRKRKMNEFVTIEAFTVLKGANRC